MTITFRCEHCQKDIKAPDEAAGKRGKCPFCGQSNYIPAPVAEEDILDLAPENEEDERRREEELRQLRKQEEALLSELGGHPEPPLDQKENISSEDLHHYVVNYCLDLANSQLERSEKTAAKLRGFGVPARQAVEDYLTGKVLEPALDAIPPRVLQGFLVQLREKVRPIVK
jgi:phage FluMu protein Com